MAIKPILQVRSHRLRLRAEHSSVFVGLDLSLTATGVAVLDKADLLTGRLAPPKNLDGPDRLIWFYEGVDKIVVDYAPKYVAIEGYSFNSKARQHALGELGGVIRTLLRRRKCPFLVVPPMTLKKFVAGSGQADKSIVMRELFKKYGVDVPTNDEADAAGLVILAALSQYDGYRDTAEMKTLLTKVESF
jgi:Holliday junction resolvasome RuvABC endonuclease subunit